MYIIFINRHSGHFPLCLFMLLWSRVFPIQIIICTGYMEISLVRKGDNYLGILIAFSLIICVIAFIATIRSLQTKDENYSMNTSFRTLSLIYIVLIPVIVLVIVGWYYLK